MITILLTILKIIGVILLALLGLILLVLCLVLFAPVKYRAKGAKHPEEMCVSALISYLRPLVRVGISYPEEPHVSVKILWIDLLRPKEEKKAGQSQAKKKTDQKKPAQKKPAQEWSAQEWPEEKPPVEKAVSLEEPQKEKAASQKEAERDKAASQKEAESGRTSSVKKAERDKAASQRESRKESSSASEERKSKRASDDFSDSEAKEENRLVAIAAFLWHYKELYPDVLGKIFGALKTILPKRCCIHLVFGTGSPETTGYLYAAYCAIGEYLPGTVEFEPVWMESYLDVEFELSGKIRAIHFVTAAVKIIADKRVRHFISEIRRI